MLTTYKGKQKTPNWFYELFWDAASLLANDYQIEKKDAGNYLVNPSNTEELVYYLSILGYTVKSYSYPELRSRGVIFDNRDPKMVELKLKYDKKEDDTD